jgi:hypothetical protein
MWTLKQVIRNAPRWYDSSCSADNCSNFRFLRRPAGPSIFFLSQMHTTNPLHMRTEIFACDDNFKVKGWRGERREQGKGWQIRARNKSRNSESRSEMRKAHPLIHFLFPLLGASEPAILSSCTKVTYSDHYYHSFLFLLSLSLSLSLVSLSLLSHPCPLISLPLPLSLSTSSLRHSLVLIAAPGEQNQITKITNRTSIRWCTQILSR